MGSMLRRFVGIFIAVSVIFAGAGWGHAGMSQSGGHGHHVMPSSTPDGAGADHHGNKTSSQHEQMTCHNNAADDADSSGNKSSGTSGCCHSVVSPSLMCQAPWGEIIDVVEGQRLLPPSDDDAQAYIPDGEFRPPRPWS